MNERDFYHHIKEGEFAFIGYPLQGISALYPHGAEVQERIANKFVGGLTEKGYLKVTLPQSVPETFVNHLHRKGLFVASNENREFFLSGSMEMQATTLARTMVNSHRDLPLRLFSRSIVYRECDPSSLIKGPEYTSYELNSFFSTREEAESEMVSIERLAKRWLTELNIPSIAVRSKPDGNSPVVLYAYFPFSESFGSIYWGGVVDKKYSEIVDFNYHGSDNKKHRPSQYNGGFTSRILAAYLANNFDQHGFVLQPSVSSAEVLIPRSQENHKINSTGNQFDNLPFSVIKARVDGRKSLVSKFGSMGIPVLLDNGKHEVSVTQRVSMDSRWVDPKDLVQVTRQCLHSAETARTPSPIPIQYIESIGDFESPAKDTVYMVPISSVGKLQELDLKIIGYVDQEKAYMVLRKY